MTELIDKSKATQRLCAACYNTGSFACISCVIPEIIKGIPTIETEPVRHGRWIFGSAKTSCWMTCSVCCKSQSVQTATFSYCPNCGAKMDLPEPQEVTQKKIIEEAKK